MDFQDLLTVIGNYAFPIIMCLLLFRKLDSDQDKHAEEIKSLRASLDNNTQAINALAQSIALNKD